jgi:hypothetical protein
MSTEDLLGFVERSSDIGWVTNIHLENEQLILRIFGCEFGENFWFTEGGNNSLPVL